MTTSSHSHCITTKVAIQVISHYLFWYFRLSRSQAWRGESSGILHCVVHRSWPTFQRCLLHQPSRQRGCSSLHSEIWTLDVNKAKWPFPSVPSTMQRQRHGPLLPVIITLHNTMNVAGVKVSFHAFLALALEVCVCSSSTLVLTIHWKWLLIPTEWGPELNLL